MKTLPENLGTYKKTASFDERSLPQGLLKNHSTKAGVWGRIIILEGSIRYIIQTDPCEIIDLAPGRDGIVEPQVLHYLQPTGPVRLYVSFYR